MFSIEYINIPTLIAILVIAYLMDDVFLFMKLGNDTTKQLMATVVGYIIAVRKFGYLRFEPFANRFGEENPLYAMGFMREKSQKSKWAAYQRGIFFWQAVTLVLAIMSKIAFILSQRFVFSDFEIVAVYMCSFLRISCVSFLVILIGYVVTWSYYMMTYHRSFRYYAGRDKVWKPFSFVGQDHYYVWPNELKVLPRTCASIYPYEEDDHVKENIKKYSLENINFTGYTNNILDYYKKADLVILASFSEGMPNVILESFANKRMVISSDIEMNRAIMKDSRFVFNPNSPQELADKIKMVVNMQEDEKKAIVEKNFEYVKNNFSIDKMVNSYWELVKGLENKSE